MRVQSLASGSSGNALLIEAGETRILLDAGLTEAALTGRLREAGVRPAQLQAILLTHEHSDHITGAGQLARRYNLPLVADARTLEAVQRFSGVTPTSAQPVGSSWNLGELEITSFPLSHDAVAPCGYVLTHQGWRICLATDVGEPATPLRKALKSADLLILEANFDPVMLANGPYPVHLKQRILSSTGHLSNSQAAQLAAEAVVNRRAWLWLAHLSKTNNRPETALACVQAHLKRQGITETSLAVLPRSKAGPVWDSAKLIQQARLFA